MTNVLITIDTEYSAGYFDRDTQADNFDRVVRCLTSEGEVGIFYQMDVLENSGLRGVFFVDPMPGLVWGQSAIDQIVEPIIERGHDVQLHLHSEWLSFAKENPLDDRTGHNIKDFSLDDQIKLINEAMDILMKAGARKPIAFRAGNYGANDDTLRALAHHGIFYDSSFPPGILDSDCAISLGRDQHVPIMHHDVLEIPIGSISGIGNSQRHAQITALSYREMTAAIKNASHQNAPCFVLVSHGFEFANRDRMLTNKLVKKRFEKLCNWLAKQQDIRTVTFQDGLELSEDQKTIELLPHNSFRTFERMAEQAVANQLYG